MSGSSKRRWQAALRRYSVPVTCGLVVALGLAFWFGSDALIWRGRQLVEQRQHDRAVWWLDRAIYFDAENAAAYLHLSRVQRRQGKPTESLENLGQAEQLGSDTDAVEREHLFHRLTKRQFPESIAAWMQLVTNAGSDLPEVCEAFVYFRLARFETIDALEILDAWQAEYPEDARAHHVRGKVLIALESWQDAAVEFEQAARIAPDQDDILFDLAKAQMQQLFYPRAIASLERCVKLNSENHEAHLLLARALSRTGEVERARKMLLLQVDLSSEEGGSMRADVLSELGELELDAGQAEQAVGFLEKAAKLAPYNRETRYLFARALRKTGDRERSRAEFDFVREATAAVSKLPGMTAEMVSDGSNLELRFQVAHLYWQFESRDTGMRWFQELLAIAPDHAPTHQILAEHFRLEGDMERSQIHQRIFDLYQERQR